mmetsp:Transcript_24931/g.36774  ORF Transcript_24931/g.36774 Transcript_24931/m.36774 type:complete len:155 (-) Transcript_24931:413-877(-)
MSVCEEMELYLAVTARDSDAVRHLVRDGKHNIEELYEDGKTALLISVMNRDIHCTTELISGGANIHCVDSAQRTPLHWAALNGDAIIVEALLESGAHTFAKDEVAVSCGVLCEYGYCNHHALDLDHCFLCTDVVHTASSCSYRRPCCCCSIANK